MVICSLFQNFREQEHFCDLVDKPTTPKKENPVYILTYSNAQTLTVTKTREPLFKVVPTT